MNLIKTLKVTLITFFRIRILLNFLIRVFELARAGSPPRFGLFRTDLCRRFEVNCVKHFVCCIVSSNDLKKHNRPSWKLHVLPASAKLLFLHNKLPSFPEQLNFDIIAPINIVPISRHINIKCILSIVTVPKQQSHASEKVGLGKLNHDSTNTKLMTSVTLFPIVLTKLSRDQCISCS